jgi:hypothetical protein
MKSGANLEVSNQDLGGPSSRGVVIVAQIQNTRALILAECDS